MGCAPILIPTLSRHIHFIRLVESLKRNAWAKYTPVYVALDYPPSEKYVEGYNKICEYLEGDFGEFLEFNVVRRDHNYGSYLNMAALREMVLKKYDRFIRTDDDAEFSPNFLEYMNKCLDKYEDDENIIAVTGYSYPIEWNVSDDSTLYMDGFICPMWGTGFWKQKYLMMQEFIERGGITATIPSKMALNKMLKRMSNVAKFEYVNLCIIPEKTNPTLIMKVSDISARLFMAINNKYVITPVLSKVRNWGFDGTGLYCPHVIKHKGTITSSNYDYKSQEIDQNMSFEVKEDILKAVAENRKLLNRFDVLPVKNMIRLYIKLVLLKLLGVKNYIKLFS